MLYVGMTNDVVRRVWQHKQKEIEGFTKRYNLMKLVLVERFLTSAEAIAREKQIKGWTRKRKIELIESSNPKWEDLAKEWYNERLPEDELPDNTMSAKESSS